MAMLGGCGGDSTSGSVFGSSGGGGGGTGGADSSSRGREYGTGEAAAAPTAMVSGSNGNNNNNNNNNNNSGGEEGFRVDEYLGERSLGGNRWPRQETLALLKIRSDMDVTFRDASVKGPLWEEVSRKLEELGYNRSAKKCREKFENVYKYHKRTKDGRTGKSDGKTYRFFDQLEALLNHTSIQLPPPPLAAAAPLPPQINPQAPPPPAMPAHVIGTVPSSNLPLNTSSADVMSSNSTSSSSTSSDLELDGRRKRKRKWKEFFERLTKEMMRKQEEMQKRFLEAIEKSERERAVREEAWRTQEMTRLNREREILAQERSMAAAKDAAVMAFLQKLSDHHQQPPPNPNIQIPPPQPPPPPQADDPTQLEAAPTPPLPVPVPVPQPAVVKLDSGGGGDQIYTGGSATIVSPSRWPKTEVLALIRLRTELDVNYQDSGPKGPLWEEISAEMRKIGYNRNAKRCKEKWENINKYFKKVKESNKKRPEDSKTCPYFHQLEALHRQKSTNNNNINQLKPEFNSVPLMVQPEQQWPPAAAEQPQHEEDMESDQNQDEDEKVYDDEEEDDDDDDGEGGGFEIVASKPVSTRTGE